MVFNSATSEWSRDRPALTNSTLVLQSSCQRALASRISQVLEESPVTGWRSRETEITILSPALRSAKGWNRDYERKMRFERFLYPTT